MEIIPAINCADQKSFQERIEQAKEFVSPNGWLHIDVSDKETTEVESFFDSSFVRSCLDYFQLEIHLMVVKERLFNMEWFFGSRVRLLVDWKNVSEEFINNAEKNNTQIGVVVNFNEDISAIALPKGISYVEVLAVSPGPSGGIFQEQALEMIKFLKERNPNVILSVDGGVNEEVARSIKQAGASVLISGSYIWGSSDPAHAYERLKRI